MPIRAGNTAGTGGLPGEIRAPVCRCTSMSCLVECGAIPGALRQIMAQPAAVSDADTISSDFCEVSELAREPISGEQLQRLCHCHFWDVSARIVFDDRY